MAGAVDRDQVVAVENRLVPGTLPRCSLANRVPTPDAVPGAGRAGAPAHGGVAGHRRDPEQRPEVPADDGVAAAVPAGLRERRILQREHRERRHEVVPKAETPPVHRIVDGAETFRQRPDRPGPAGVLPEPHRPNSRQ